MSDACGWRHPACVFVKERSHEHCTTTHSHYRRHRRRSRRGAGRGGIGAQSHGGRVRRGRMSGACGKRPGRVRGHGDYGVGLDLRGRLHVLLHGRPLLLRDGGYAGMLSLLRERPGCVSQCGRRTGSVSDGGGVSHGEARRDRGGESSRGECDRERRKRGGRECRDVLRRGRGSRNVLRAGSIRPVTPMRRQERPSFPAS